MRRILMTKATQLAFAALLCAHLTLSASVLSKVGITKDPVKTRADYVARMQQQTSPRLPTRR